MTGKIWRFWTNSAIFSPPIISPVMIKHAIIFPSKVVLIEDRIALAENGIALIT